MTIPESPAEHPVPEEVAAGVWRLRLPMSTSPGHINSWLLADGDGWTVVDCGTREDCARASWRAFMASPLYGAGIRRIFLTHAHPDHGGSAPWLARETGAPVLMAEAERETLDSHQVDNAVREAEIAAWVGSWGASEKQIGFFQDFYHGFALGCPPIHSTIETVREGDTLTIGGRRWQLHAGLGHTPCNLLLHAEDDQLLITGDQVLPDIVPNVSIWWRQDPNPLERYLESLARLRLLSVRQAFPSHGDPFADYTERCDQLRRTQEQRIERLASALAGGAQSVSQLLKSFGGQAVDSPMFPLVAGQIYARLAYLIERGRVTSFRDDDGGLYFQQAVP